MESGGGFFTSIQNMMVVAADNAYLNNSALAFFGLGCLHWVHSVITTNRPGHCLPSKDILCVVVPQIYFCWPAYWNSCCLSIIRFQKIRSSMVGQLLKFYDAV